MKSICIYMGILFLSILPLLAADEAVSILAERYRQEAAAAQTSGRELNARNAWYKYVRIHELEPSSAEERERIKKWINDVDDRMWPKTAAAVPAPVPVVLAPERRSPARQALSSVDLTRKAERLRRNGQLEEALRLYRLAEKTEPAEKTKAAIAELEAEMK